MSLLPFLLGETRPRRLSDQLFGLVISPDDFLTDIVTERPFIAARHYIRPWKRLEAELKDVGSSIKTDKDKFQLNLDVQHFTPEEISVKTADGYIVVEGKHEEKQDEHGYVSRQFSRRYALPEGCTPETVESKLSSDGVLTVTAPRKLPRELEGERVIPIAQTGPVRRKITDSSNDVCNGNAESNEEKSPQKKKRR